jgi:multiple sugar transport system substrate-binding protein
MKNRPLLALALTSLLFVGAGCFGNQTPAAPAPVTLEYWRTEDDSTALEPVIAAYRKLHPHISIQPTTLRSEDYERELIKALAEDRGPDLFSLPNYQLRAWQAKLLPVPPSITVPTQAVDENKNIVTINRKTAGFSLLALRNQFVEGAASEVVMYGPSASDPDEYDERIFGLPISFDTMGLYYNKDLFLQAGLEKPPATWRDLQDMAAKLTVLGADKEIITSGAAIGGARNVRYSEDILALIMSQNGAQLADENGYAIFNQFTNDTRNREFTPGVQGLMFYQGFVNPGAYGYSWNELMPDSFDAFVAGKTAMYFGYPQDAKAIRASAPRLDFGIAPVPQVDMSKPRNIARYPVEVVSRKTKHPNEAWDFLTFLATREASEIWLNKTKRPSSLRSLISNQLTDPEIAPFAGQTLTGRSWYRGEDWTRVEAAFDMMILFRPTREQTNYQTILNNVADAVNSTY